MNELKRDHISQEAHSEQREPSGAVLTRKMILDLYTQKFENRQTADLSNIVDGEDRVSQKIHVRMGDIAMAEVPDGKAGIVPTDSGVILSEGHELLTNRVSGCMVAFGIGKSSEGEDRVIMVHLTPRSRLGWGNYKEEDDDRHWGHDTREYSAGKIADAMKDADVDFESVELTLLRTMGVKSQKYEYGWSEESIQRKVDDMRGALEEQGVHVGEDHALPMHEMAIHWTPNASDELYIVGERQILDEGGARSAEGDEKGVDSQVIKLAA